MCLEFAALFALMTPTVTNYDTHDLEGSLLDVPGAHVADFRKTVGCPAGITRRLPARPRARRAALGAPPVVAVGEEEVLAREDAPPRGSSTGRWRTPRALKMRKARGSGAARPRARRRRDLEDHRALAAEASAVSS